MADLPQSFLDSMKEILGEDYEAFLTGIDGQRQYGLRVNTLKMNLEEFERIAPFHLKKVPWISNGYFYNAEDVPAKHPFYSAGLYYLQEPSAMTPASRLKVQPWALAKDPAKQDRLATVLYNLVESITIGASLLSPFMPETAERIFAQLNSSERTMDELEMFGLYESGKKVTDKPEILFARLDAKEVQAKVDEMNASRQAPAEEEKKDDEPVIDIEPKEEITFDDFEKMQFQVGEIIACEEVKKSKKLLCSQVKIGSQVKQIVSGIKKHYSAEEMVGKKVMVLVNLKPAKLAGVLSEGMLLCAEDENGELSLMVPEKKMPAGAEIC